MNLLAIETTGPYASTALIDHHGRRFFRTSDRFRSHLSSLIPLISELLAEAELKPVDLTQIAVSIGPGSFTGIRIGLATARGLADALALPLVPVPTLRAFLWNQPTVAGWCAPMFDARREQVYAGVYEPDGALGRVWVSDQACSLVDWFSEMDRLDPDRRRPLFVFGDGIDRYESQIRAWRDDAEIHLVAPPQRYQSAAAVAECALRLVDAGELFAPEAVTPVYLRQAEAERKLAERLQQPAEPMGAVEPETGGGPSR